MEFWLKDQQLLSTQASTEAMDALESDVVSAGDEGTEPELRWTQMMQAAAPAPALQNLLVEAGAEVGGRLQQAQDVSESVWAPPILPVPEPSGSDIPSKEAAQLRRG